MVQNTDTTLLLAQVREQIVGKLEEIEVSSMETVQQKTSVMFEVTKEKEEISQKSLKTGTKVVSDLSSGFVDLTENSTSRQIEETGKYVNIPHQFPVINFLFGHL